MNLVRLGDTVYESLHDHPTRPHLLRSKLCQGVIASVVMAERSSALIDQFEDRKVTKSVMRDGKRPESHPPTIFEKQQEDIAGLNGTWDAAGTPYLDGRLLRSEQLCP